MLCFPLPLSLSNFQGIVAAVRNVGGRFLELDERSGIYHDIGDRKAIKKTSQALREGQTRTYEYSAPKRVRPPKHSTMAAGGGGDIVANTCADEASSS
jgi:hypothetical protein